MFGGAEELPDGFWRHSVAVAAGASIAARLASVPPGDALCAGLLHDLGAALCYRFDPAPYIVRLDAGIDPSALLEAEARAYGGDHAMVEPACDPGAAFAALGLTAVSIENLVRRTAEEAEALDAVLCSAR